MSGMSEERRAALNLVGKFVCWVHQPDGPPMYCVLADKHGMVELLGWSGRFAAHLFIPASQDVLDRALDG